MRRPAVRPRGVAPSEVVEEGAVLAEGHREPRDREIADVRLTAWKRIVGLHVPARCERPARNMDEVRPNLGVGVEIDAPAMVIASFEEHRVTHVTMTRLLDHEQVAAGGERDLLKRRRAEALLVARDENPILFAVPKRDNLRSGRIRRER